jgi:hypothetical protein
MKLAISKSIRDQKGQALVLVLILMTVGVLIVTPLLSFMFTGLKAGQTYEAIADEFYAADSGVADGLWQIKYDHLETLFSTYDLYDYTSEWKYNLAEQVNDNSVAITIKNVWIPKSIAEPTNPDYVRQLIMAGKLMIVGNVSAQSTQQIRIYYYRDVADPPLQVTEVGIWVPPGFSYDTMSECTLETWLASKHKDYSRTITPHCGGQAVVWTLTDVLFTELPGVDLLDQPMTSIFTFKFTSAQPGRTPEALSWIKTSGVSDIPYTWDADVKVYYISSQAGGEDGTTVDAYAIKTELRKLGSAIAGDYRAIGNTLMIEGSGHGYNPYGIRYQLLGESDNSVSDIPVTAQVDAAYLYWSAWIEEVGEETLFFDDCTDLDNGNWNYGSDWHESGSSSAFYAHHTSGGGRELTMKNTTDLSSYGPGKVTVSWRNWLYRKNIESGDCFQYAFRNASGWGAWNTVFCDDWQVGTSPVTFSFTVPNEYLTSDFKMKFQITGFSNSNEYCYIDDITITAEAETIADTSVIFKINGDQVYFEDDEYGFPTVPTKGFEKIEAGRYQVLENFTGSGDPHGFSYACFKDVTGLLQAFSNEGSGGNRTGNGTYAVGDVYGDTGDEWSYAAWSLIVIYSSPETKGHQLYLYDEDFVYSDMYCNVDFDGDGEGGGTISGFLVPDPIRDPETGEIIEEVAAQITCFIGEGDNYYDDDSILVNGHKLHNSVSPQDNVWNSKSPGLEEDGIDIDTFSIKWEDEILEPGDSSVQVDLTTWIDSWNLIYIILSFRSATITGGTVTYLLRE